MSEQQYVSFCNNLFPEDDFIIEVTAEQAAIIKSAERMVTPDLAILGEAVADFLGDAARRPFPHLCYEAAEGPGGQLLRELRDFDEPADARPSEIAAAERDGRIIEVDMDCDGSCVANAA